MLLGLEVEVNGRANEGDTSLRFTVRNGHYALEAHEGIIRYNIRLSFEYKGNVPGDLR